MLGAVHVLSRAVGWVNAVEVRLDLVSAMCYSVWCLLRLDVCVEAILWTVRAPVRLVFLSVPPWLEPAYTVELGAVVGLLACQCSLTRRDRAHILFAQVLEASCRVQWPVVAEERTESRDVEQSSKHSSQAKLCPIERHFTCRQFETASY